MLSDRGRYYLREGDAELHGATGGTVEVVGVTSVATGIIAVHGALSLVASSGKNLEDVEFTTARSPA